MTFVEPGAPITTGRVVDRWPTWTRLAGIAFAVVFVAGMIIGRDTPDTDASDDEWVRWFDDSGHRAQQVVSLFLLVIAALLLVVFAVGLVRQLRAASGDRGGSIGIAYSGAIITAVAIAVGGVAVNQISAAVELGDMPEPGADVLRTAEQLGFGLLLVVAGLFAALTVAAVSAAARGTGLLPSWLVNVGFAVAVILLFSVVFLPMALFPLWVLAVAIAVGRPVARTPVQS
jgi:hypothetical protein